MAHALHSACRSEDMKENARVLLRAVTLLFAIRTVSRQVSALHPKGTVFLPIDSQPSYPLFCLSILPHVLSVDACLLC